MRRRIPWFVVAVLFLVWAFHLYSDRFGDPHVPSDLADRSLLYLDRTLRLEEEALLQPEIIKRTLFSSDYDEVLKEASNALEALDQEDLLGEDGLRALAVTCDASGTPLGDPTGVDETTVAILSGRAPDERGIGELTMRLEKPETTNWWDARLAEKALEISPHQRLSAALSFHHQETRRLFRTQLASSAVWWLLLIGGWFFMPHTLRVVRRGWTSASLHRPWRYGSRWDPTVVIALLLAADLAANYFLDVAYATANGVQYDLNVDFAFDVIVDSLWRILAPAIALIVLFRKPGHAVRSLGLDAPVDWKLILAMFSLISWINLGFSTLVEPWTEFDPTGGIDPMERGWGGLFYGLLSACILAPVVEEIFYRGILFRGLLRKFGFWLSAGVSTLAFVLAHSYDFFGLVTIGVFGFGMVIIHRTTGSLRTAILLHALYNFTITLPDWLLYHAGK